VACTGAGRSLVMADPTFEALARYVDVTGGPVVKVPLTSDYRHDLKAMLTPSTGAGLVYVCNPNNPTATVTPAAELSAFLAAVPPTTTVLVDEAYHHYVTGGGYESVMGQVPQRPNLLVARTFSKIYGMAGLRCGYAVGQAELIARLRRQQAWDNMNVAVLAAAAAALADPDHVDDARQRNAKVRQEACDALAARGFRVVPSQANFFMVDLGQPVKPVIAGLRAQGVEVGRLFPALPTHLRVTVGKREEMQAFLAALAHVLPAAA
jgi:histidinol-phosphate aminotransferase